MKGCAERGAKYREDQENYEQSQLQLVLEQEREAILSDQNLIAEEKQKLLAEAEEREEKLRGEREAQEGLAAKIKVGLIFN